MKQLNCTQIKITKQKLNRGNIKYVLIKSIKTKMGNTKRRNKVKIKNKYILT